MIRENYRAVGECPKCGVFLARYHYIVEGPVDETRETTRVVVSIQCPVCGYSDEKKIIFPVKALYMIRYILVPELRPTVEKLYALYRIRLADVTGDLNKEE